MSNCFCHFNGYEVKDAAARRGIEELNALIPSLESTITEQNKGEKITFWLGNSEEYGQIFEKEKNCFYIVTDDNSLEKEIESAIERITNLENGAGESELENISKTFLEYQTNTEKAILELHNYVTPQMFGAAGDGVTDDTQAINAALSKGGNIVFPDGEYLINGLCGYYDNLDNMGLVVKSDSNIILSKKAIIKQTGGTASERSIIFNINGCENVTISGGQLIGDSETHVFNGENTHEWGHGVYIRKSKNIIIKEMIIKNMVGDGVYVGQTGYYSDNTDVHNYNIILEKLDIRHIGRNGISLTECTNWTIRDCVIDDIYRTAPKAGIDIELEGDLQPIQKEGVIDNVKITNAATGLLVIYNTEKAIIKNSAINNICASEGQKLDIHNSNTYLTTWDNAEVNVFDSNITLYANSDKNEFGVIRFYNSSITAAIAVKANIEFYNCLTNSAFNTYGTIKSFNSKHRITSNSDYAFYIRKNSMYKNCVFIIEKLTHALSVSTNDVKLSIIGCTCENTLSSDWGFAMVSGSALALITNTNYSGYATAYNGELISGCTNFKF